MKVPIRNTAEAYGALAQLLHWAVVAGIALQFVWAWRIDRTDSIREEFALVNQHKSIGITVLMLAVLRLAWRAFNRPPPLPAGLPHWERLAARATHWLLYVLIFAMPLTGWAYTSAAGYGPEWFGWLDLPDLVAASERLEEIFGAVHEALAVTLAAVAALHAAAALRHHCVLRDNVLKRMLPTWTTSKRQ